MASFMESLAYIYVCTHTHACIHLCTMNLSMPMSVCQSRCMHLCARLYLHATGAHSLVCMYTSTYMYVCVYMYTHI